MLGDWKFFGFDGPTKTTYTAQGIEVEELNIRIQERALAAKEASKYLYSQKQAMDLKVPEGITIKVVDYSKS